jgi:hypothetical protein
MSYVVTNNKVFKEFSSLEDAVRYHKQSDEFGMKIVERDVFGNLNPVDEKKVENASTRIHDTDKFQEQIPGKPQPQQQPVEMQAAPAQQPVENKEDDTLLKYIKWGVLLVLGAILMWVFFLMIFPIIQDFYLAWRHV